MAPEQKVVNVSSSMTEPLCKLVMEQAGDAMVLAGLDGRVLDFNQRAVEMLVRPRAVLAGSSLVDLHAPPVRESLLDLLHGLRERPHAVVEVELLRGNGTTVHTEASLSRIENPDTGDCFILAAFREIESRRRAEEERLRAEKRHRDALVREVHHRIKNHLQGLLGLFEEQSIRHPEAREIFADAMTQINSIALVHGLQSTQGSEELRLCDMAAAICQANQRVWGGRDKVDFSIQVKRPLVIVADECVPIALVINELIANAVKHSRHLEASVKVEVRDAGNGYGEVLVHNAGGLPKSFHLPALRSLHSGLGLAQALLPADGVELTVEDVPGAGKVCSRLTLGPPILITSA